MTRPVITDLERSRADIIIETLAALALALLVGLTIYYYPQLPDDIPAHFDFRGQPDRIGYKGTLLMMPSLGVLIFMGLTILGRYPHIYNYPCPITESNARRQYALARQLLAAVKLLSLIIFAYIAWGQIATAKSIESGLSPWILLSATASIFLVLGVYLVRALRAR
jgi:uncharacterized membrane protein